MWSSPRRSKGRYYEITESAYPSPRSALKLGKENGHLSGAFWPVHPLPLQMSAKCSDAGTVAGECGPFAAGGALIEARLVHSLH